MDEYILHSQDLTVGYGKRVLLRGVELRVRPGEILTLIGPNGVGKSTLLKTITRQLAALGGAVFVGGERLEDMNERRAAQTMSILMTQRVEPELMTCGDVVSAGRYPYTGRFGLLSQEDRRQVAAAMELVDVTALRDLDFNRVSDGQRQRVMLARAICQEPSVLILDEPASFLDIRYKLELMDILRRLTREKNVAVVMTLHELELARYISDRLVCVKDGAVDKIGGPEEIFAGGYIRELYGVESESFSDVYGALERPRERTPSFQHYIRSGQKLLRCGYTTGTCAALAAAGAARLLLTGEAPELLELITPRGLPVAVEPEYCRMLSGTEAECAVRKDAGDDPDITDGILVCASVERADDGEIVVDGGPGVGRVTKPGLDQPVGAAAINRVPRAMIRAEAEAVCRAADYTGGLRVVISIPQGAELAARTFNPQLGIEGGLSVLGTSGVVEPMSEQALVDTIEVSLRQAEAEGDGRVILTPGNYGRDFLRSSGYEGLGVPVVKYSNYVGEALDIAAGMRFREILFVGHIGKLVKLAGGIMNTHSKYADGRTELFCAHAALCGADTAVCRALMDCVTADACINVLDAAGLRESVMESLLAAIEGHIRRRAGDALRTGAVVFSNTYGLLGMTETGRKMLDEWEKNPL